MRCHVHNTSGARGDRSQTLKGLPASGVLAFVVELCTGRYSRVRTSAWVHCNPQIMSPAVQSLRLFASMRDERVEHIERMLTGRRMDGFRRDYELVCTSHRELVHAA